MVKVTGQIHRCERSSQNNNMKFAYTFLHKGLKIVTPLKVEVREAVSLAPGLSLSLQQV